MEQATPGQSAAAADSRIIAQTRDLRVVEYVLQPREHLAWHHHSEITDQFYCLTGTIRVEVRAPMEAHLLGPGESCSVPPGTVHRPVNAGDRVSSYLLIQGVGRYDFIRAD